MIGAMGAAALGGQSAPRRPGARGRGREAAVALVSLVPALLALRGGDLAAYHGVEHKAIAGYEEDADAADADKEHDRCGSHLVAPMLAAAAVGQRRRCAARACAARRPRPPWASAAPRVAVEVFAWSSATRTARSRDCCAGPGTRSSASSARASPATEQLEVARAALAEILRAERRA